MGIIDDNRVGIRNIDSRFNNSGCYQYVVCTLNKVEHILFKNLSIHLSVTNPYTYTRAKSLNHTRNFLDISNAIVYKKHLSTS